MKCVCGYEQEKDFEEFIGGLYLCPKCGTFKAKTADDEVVNPELLHKEMKCYCITGTHKHPEKGYTLKLYNGDNPRNPDESASIKMSTERFENFVRNLSLWLPSTNESNDKPDKSYKDFRVESNPFNHDLDLILTNSTEAESRITLSPDKVQLLIDILKARLPKESKSDPTYRFNLIVSMSMMAARMIDAGEIECSPGRLCEFINNIVDKYLSDFANTLKFDNYVEMTLRANFGVKTKSACPCDTCRSIMKDSFPINCKATCETFWDWYKHYGYR